jgi:2-methylisocitrate lyase-like PEP mutase family enzyme
VNVIMGLAGASFSVDQLAAAGVRRISLGSALSRAALGAFLRAAREIKERGTFGFADSAASFAEIHRFMEGRPT